MSDLSASSINMQGDEPQQTSKLIEFPGVSRSTVPYWRKELSERVREVQEKRAREEALDLELTKTPLPEQLDAAAQLELLPQPAAAPVNPLVAAALRRIERAYVTAGVDNQSAHLAGATAVAFTEPVLCDEPPREVVNLEIPNPHFEEPTPQQDKAHNLVVVPPTTTSPAPNVSKPRRMIGDLDDPALNYLDSVRVAAPFETSKHERASILSRLVSAFVDLIVVSALCAPFAAALELINADWNSLRVWVIAAVIFCIVGFLYFTVSTALTGRTVGLKLLSLRIVDARTGLIPTGTQAAGRALIYLASLLILGVTSIIALLNPDRLTAHDRITRTAVVNG
ncbi:MAG TPA: RDD family protein [Pyrinomonadaceae bacterium]|nr:RDD family protein [Pyrinomonadaceae bacterium]